MRKSLLWPGVAVILLVIVAVLVAAVGHRSPALPAAAATASPTAQSAAAYAPAVTDAPAIVGPGGFVPLQSQAVKDAIHRALATGATQRWQDGTLSGYAVPSVVTGANGCRAIRYTIDQQPGTPYGSITACDASAR